MPLYDELATKAIEFSKRYHDHREACQVFARQVAATWMSYLDAPLERFKFVELDADLKTTSKVSDLGMLPKLTRGEDGREHAGFSLLYKVDKEPGYFMTERFVLGFNQSGQGWQITWDKQVYSAGSASLQELDPLFQALTAESVQRFQGQLTSAGRAPIGFTPFKWEPTREGEA